MNNWDICRVVTKKHIRKAYFVQMMMIAVLGYVVGKVSKISVNSFGERLNRLTKNSYPRKAIVINFNGIYSSEDGFELTLGDKFKVLEQDEKYALIRKVGKFNNLHRIPIEVLNGLLEH